MALIQFESKPAEGFYLLATHGEVGGYPGNIFAVTDRLLEDLDGEFKARGITYRRVNRQNSKNPARKEKGA
jgi:hypothetical protein